MMLVEEYSKEASRLHDPQPGTAQNVLVEGNDCWTEMHPLWGAFLRDDWACDPPGEEENCQEIGVKR